MKKIFLLSIASLAMLMADFTLIGEELTPVTETTDPVVEPTPTSPTATEPVSISGVIPNSLDLIWADMHEANTGWVSNMQSAYLQFQGPDFRNVNDATYDTHNIWIEVEAAGDGSSCSTDINKATNTRVEIGWTRGYMLKNGTWSKFTEAKQQIGAAHPTTNMNFPSRGCGATFENIINANREYMSTNISRTEPSGFRSVKPQHYFRWHGWAPRVDVSPVTAVYGVVYVRLIVDNPNLPDDRHLANYVAHIGSDRQILSPASYVAGTGISRYKRITNDWQPLNFLTEMSRADFESNPPPLISTP